VSQFLLPEFGKLWAEYPHGTADAVKQLIGGNINLGWVTNTCVIRVSRALNYAGDPIPGDMPGVSTARGGDGMRYAYRVSEFKEYMNQRYGPPSLTLASSNRGAFGGTQGIICFDVGIWSDATGHFDLWDGGQCAHNCYWSEATEVAIWAC